MSHDPSPNVFSLGLNFVDDGGVIGHLAETDMGHVAAGSDAPEHALLAIRPADRAARALTAAVLADVRDLMAAAGIRATTRASAALTTATGTVVRVDASAPASIGRQPDASIIVMDSRASRRHCAVSVTADGIVIEDLGSTNGTWVRRGGDRITVHPGVAVRLQHGDAILCEELEIASVAVIEDIA